jgi:hypothetical protein
MGNIIGVPGHGILRKDGTLPRHTWRERKPSHSISNESIWTNRTGKTYWTNEQGTDRQIHQIRRFRTKEDAPLRYLNKKARELNWKPERGTYWTRTPDDPTLIIVYSGRRRLGAPTAS